MFVLELRCEFGRNRESHVVTVIVSKLGYGWLTIHGCFCTLVGIAIREEWRLRAIRHVHVLKCSYT